MCLVTMEHGFLFVFNENGIQFAKNGYDTGIEQLKTRELIKQGLYIYILKSIYYL